MVEFHFPHVSSMTTGTYIVFIGQIEGKVGSLKATISDCHLISNTACVFEMEDSSHDSLVELRCRETNATTEILVV